MKLLHPESEGALIRCAPLERVSNFVKNWQFLYLHPKDVTFLATMRWLAASLIFGTDDFDSWECEGTPGTVAGRGICRARNRLSHFWICRVPLWSTGSSRRVCYSLNTWDHAVSLWVLKDLGKSERASPARLNWSLAMDSDKPTYSVDGTTVLGAVKQLCPWAMASCWLLSCWSQHSSRHPLSDGSLMWALWIAIYPSPFPPVSWQHWSAGCQVLQHWSWQSKKRRTIRKARCECGSVHICVQLWKGERNTESKMCRFKSVMDIVFQENALVEVKIHNRMEMKSKICDCLGRDGQLAYMRVLTSSR